MLTLQAALRKRNLPIQGIKLELVARLTKSDKDRTLAGDSAHSVRTPDNVPLHSNTETSSVTTASESTTEDSAVSQEVGDC